MKARQGSSQASSLPSQSSSWPTDYDWSGVSSKDFEQIEKRIELREWENQIRDEDYKREREEREKGR